MEETQALLTLAQKVEFNEKAEAQAILDYTDLLSLLEGIEGIEKTDKTLIKETIKEIVGDELNHQSRLKMLYKLLTGIKEKKD